MSFEIWKPIKGFEGLYEISNTGLVKSLRREVPNNGGISIVKEKILKPQKEKNGYLRIGLNKRNKKYMFLIHRLIAESFIPNVNNYAEINHKDGNKSNNNVDNLEWCSRSYNIKHSYINKLRNTDINRKNAKKMIEKNKRKVVQKDLNGNMINIFDSIKEAGELTNIDKTNICSVCKHKGYYKTAGGYIWEYYNTKETVIK